MGELSVIDKASSIRLKTIRSDRIWTFLSTCDPIDSFRLKKDFRQEPQK